MIMLKNLLLNKMEEKFIDEEIEMINRETKQSCYQSVIMKPLHIFSIWKINKVYEL